MSNLPQRRQILGQTFSAPTPTVSLPVTIGGESDVAFGLTVDEEVLVDGTEVIARSLLSLKLVVDLQPVAVTLGTTAGDELYNSIEPIWLDDAERGYPLRTYCRAVGSMLEDLIELVRDSDDGPGWSALLDFNRAPVGALPYLGQLIGVTVSNGASSLQQRLEIQGSGGFRRGSVGRMTEEAQKTLDGLRTVTIFERDTSPYHFTVVTYDTETPDPAATEAAVRAQKPAGLVMDYEVRSGQSYQQLLLVGSYQDVKDTYSDYLAAREDT